MQLRSDTDAYRASHTLINLLGSFEIWEPLFSFDFYGVISATKKEVAARLRTNFICFAPAGKLLTLDVRKDGSFEASVAPHQEITANGLDPIRAEDAILKIIMHNGGLSNIDPAVTLG